MATQATGQQRRQQVPWNPQKQDADDSRPSFIGREPTLKHDIFNYQETQQAQKYRDNIETLKIYVGRKHTKYTAELVSSLDTLTFSIPEELAVLTETSPTPGALKNLN